MGAPSELIEAQIGRPQIVSTIIKNWTVLVACVVAAAAARQLLLGARVGLLVPGAEFGRALELAQVWLVWMIIVFSVSYRCSFVVFCLLLLLFRRKGNWKEQEYFAALERGMIMSSGRLFTFCARALSHSSNRMPASQPASQPASSRAHH